MSQPQHVPTPVSVVVGADGFPKGFTGRRWAIPGGYPGTPAAAETLPPEDWRDRLSPDERLLFADLSPAAPIKPPSHARTVLICLVLATAGVVAVIIGG